MKQYGSQSMVDPLKRVIVKRPEPAFATDFPKRWHYKSQPVLREALREHDDLTAVLRAEGAEVIFHTIGQPDHADAIFVHDPVIVCDKGAVLLRMGKELRRGEEEIIAQTLEKAGVPIHYRLHGDAMAEGGDLVWIDHSTLAAGVGYRTNAEGIRQLREALEPIGVTVVEVPLPHYHGPDACLHLMSLMSMLDHDLAVVHLPLMPVPFVQFLRDRGITFIEIPENEFDTQATNVLAIKPRVCLILQDNLQTIELLRSAGCTVYTYKGDEISHKAEGGPTCLTRPILRA